MLSAPKALHLSLLNPPNVFTHPLIFGRMTHNGVIFLVLIHFSYRYLQDVYRLPFWINEIHLFHFQLHQILEVLCPS